MYKKSDYILYCSWHMARDGCNCCFSFRAISCPFTSLAAQKVKISKQWKKPMEISSFYTSVPKIMIIRYTVPEIWRMTDVIAIFILGYTFPFFLPNSPKNENFKTMKKRLGDIILHKCTKNHDHILYCYWDMTRARCNCYFSFWTIFSPFTPLTAQ